MGLSRQFAELGDKDKRVYMSVRADVRRAIIEGQRRLAGDNWNETDDLVLDRLDQYLDELVLRGHPPIPQPLQPPVVISAPRSRKDSMPAVDMGALEDALSSEGSQPA